MLDVKDKSSQRWELISLVEVCLVGLLESSFPMICADAGEILIIFRMYEDLLKFTL